MTNTITNRAYMLRTCRVEEDGTLRSSGGFEWPRNGYVAAADWDPDPASWGGLHGLLWGEGDGRLLRSGGDAAWLVVAIDTKQVVNLWGHVKAPWGYVVHCGDRYSATQWLVDHGADEREVVGTTLTGRDHAVLVGGDYSTLFGGDYATLTGGACSVLAGGDYSRLSAWHGSTLTGGDHAVLVGGDNSTLTGGSGSALTGRDYCTLVGGDGSTLTGGEESILTGGEGSQLRFEYYDLVRDRIAVAYVGEDGVAPGVAYRCNMHGEIVRADEEA
jgi:hypothetical protein